MEQLTRASFIVFLRLYKPLVFLFHQLKSVKLNRAHLNVVSQHDEPSLDEEWAEFFNLLLFIVALWLSLEHQVAQLGAEVGQQGVACLQRRAPEKIFREAELLRVVDPFLDSLQHCLEVLSACLDLLRLPFFEKTRHVFSIKIGQQAEHHHKVEILLLIQE